MSTLRSRTSRAHRVHKHIRSLTAGGAALTTTLAAAVLPGSAAAADAPAAPATAWSGDSWHVDTADVVRRDNILVNASPTLGKFSMPLATAPPVPRSGERPDSRPYLRFERPGPMQLWQMDIVGGIGLVDTITGEVREAKVVTAVDDHSRYCVIAKVVERATARAVCVALAEALVRFGVPEEIITDNGKQFTDRFGRHGTRNGEVLFDKICRRNGITHRLTAPASPSQNGKVCEDLARRCTGPGLTPAKV